jgi:hypothetical protein
MLLTECTKPNINSMTNYHKICMTSWILVYHQSPKSGSDLVDLLVDLLKILIILHSFIFTFHLLDRSDKYLL